MVCTSVLLAQVSGPEVVGVLVGALVVGALVGALVDAFFFWLLPNSLRWLLPRVDVARRLFLHTDIFM